MLLKPKSLVYEMEQVYLLGYFVVVTVVVSFMSAIAAETELDASTFASLLIVKGGLLHV